MNVKRISFSKINYLSNFDIKYANGDLELQSFMAYTPDLQSFDEAISNRRKYPSHREDLVAILMDQHTSINSSENIIDQIDSLRDSDTFTVCTAHQLNVFLGPLYYVYKILTVIKMSQKVSARSGHKIVPVFVMGGEDHDFEEIQFANIFSKKWVWENNQHGPVGRMQVDDALRKLCLNLFETLGQVEHADFMIDAITKSYLSYKSYGQASQKFISNLFAPFGLVVLHMDDPRSKKLLAPIIEEELTQQSSHKIVEKTTNKLSKRGIKVQVNPREINLFYFSDIGRERIQKEGDMYQLADSQTPWTKEEILEKVLTEPERFSPNVILRPLYQEILLPNLCYVGGGGELAYWSELKDLFNHHKVHFPILMRRESVLTVDPRSLTRSEKLGFTTEELFGDLDELIRSYVERESTSSLSLKNEKEKLNQIFIDIEEKAKNIDPTLGKSMAAESIKWQKAFEQMESRLVRTEKKKNEYAINQLKGIKEKLFPHNGLQERHENFIPYFLKYGYEYFNQLLEYLDPFDRDFLVIEGM